MTFSHTDFKKWSCCIFLINSGGSKTFSNVLFSIILIILTLLLQTIRSQIKAHCVTLILLGACCMQRAVLGLMIQPRLGRLPPFLAFSLYHPLVLEFLWWNKESDLEMNGIQNLICRVFLHLNWTYVSQISYGSLGIVSCK